MVSLCYYLGIPISDLKHYSYRRLSKIIHYSIKLKNNSRTTKGRKATQQDINKFLG